MTITMIISGQDSQQHLVGRARLHLSYRYAAWWCQGGSCWHLGQRPWYVKVGASRRGNFLVEKRSACFFFQMSFVGFSIFRKSILGGSQDCFFSWQICHEIQPCPKWCGRFVSKLLICLQPTANTWNGRTRRKGPVSGQVHLWGWSESFRKSLKVKPFGWNPALMIREFNSSKN